MPDPGTAHEGTMVERMLAIQAEHERAEREDELSPTLSCPLGIHGFYQRTPNTLCPWCEWEDAEQRIAAALESLDAMCADEDRHGSNIRAHEVRGAVADLRYRPEARHGGESNG